MGRKSLIGTVLGGSYEIECELGGGGMGAVYQARHLRTGRAYAIKVLLSSLSTDPEALGRFRREAETVGRLGHAGIVGIHDFDREDDGTTFIVMDYLEGEDLEQRLSRTGGLPWSVAFGIFVEVSEALSAAHEIGIIHRDLKPANIFLAKLPGAIDRAVILDFGLAKVMNPEPAMTQLTQTGMVMGTPQYMSPEQANGHGVDHRTDLYAMACVLFQMLTGDPPFNAMDMPSIFAMIMTETPPAVSQHCQSPIPVGLDEVLARALSKDPAERFNSARDMLEAMRALGSPVEPSPGMAHAEAPLLATPRGAVTAPSAHPALAPPPIDQQLLTPPPMVTRQAAKPLVRPVEVQPSVAPLRTAPPVATLPSVSPILQGTPASPSSYDGPAQSGFDGPASSASFAHSAPPPSGLASTEPPRRLGGLAFIALVTFFGAFVLVASAAFTWWLFSFWRSSNDGYQAVVDASTEADTFQAIATAPDVGVATKIGSVVETIAPPPLPPLPPPPEAITLPPPLQKTVMDGGPGTLPAKSSGARPVPAKTPSGTKNASNSKNTKLTANQRVQRATDLAARGDFRGCLRELRPAPQTSRVLTTKLACAQNAGDRAEVRRTCGLIRQRYPRSAQAAGCGLLTGFPIKLPF